MYENRVIIKQKIPRDTLCELRFGACDTLVCVVPKVFFTARSAALENFYES